MSPDRRHPLRPFDPSAITSFLHGRSVSSIELFPAGKSSTSYRLVLDDSLVCVLRLLPAPTAARESRILELARTAVPVPEVFASGPDWLVLSHVEGRHLSEAPECTHAAAAALAKLAQIRFDAAGWIQADGTVTPFDFGHEDGFVGSMLSRDDVQRLIGPKTAADLSQIINENARRQEPWRSATLCHGDFNPTNILTHNGEVSGILDWEFAHAGDPYMDLGNLLRGTPPAYHEQIRSGFAAAGRELPADWKRRAELVDVSSHLEFLTSPRSDAFKQTCVRWLHDFIARYQAV